MKFFRKFFGGGNSQSTKDVTVFAMRRSESQLEKEIQLACAQRGSKIDAFLENSSNDIKQEFWTKFLALVDAIDFQITVSERLLLFIDTNVLQDIIDSSNANQQERITRYYSLLAFLYLVEDYYCLDIFACISPAILYEASHRGRLPFKDAISNTIQQLAKVGLKTHLVGFRTESELKRICGYIKRDEASLLKALNAIKNKNWERDFKSPLGKGIALPFGVAESECPEVKLNYFNPSVVKFLLMHNIEKRMFDENKNNPAARKYMGNPQEKAFSIISPNKKNGVEGLGDIELLTYCNLREQTYRRDIDITAGVTFDKGLRDALHKMTGTQNTMTMVGGVDTPEDSAIRFTYHFLHNQRRTDKANRRAKEYAGHFQDFARDFLAKHFKGGNSQQSSNNPPP